GRSKRPACGSAPTPAWPRQMTKATRRMAMAAMAAPQSTASDVARRLGMTTTTLYAYGNGRGSLKPTGWAFLDKAEWGGADAYPPSLQRSWYVHYHHLGTPAIVLISDHPLPARLARPSLAIPCRCAGFLVWLAYGNHPI